MTTDQIKSVSADRTSEWFVPAFGPARFRSFIGLLFLPYTGMVLSFSVIGSMVATEVHWDRLVAILLIFLFGLGIAAHALDALGSKRIKPWGAAFTRVQLWLLAIVSLVVAYTVAIYYALFYVPLLWLMAVAEGFFVFAYNLEWFGGRFHTDAWFALSWGALPALSGYIMQTNTVSLPAMVLALSTMFFSLIEIKASRPYREMKRSRQEYSEHEEELILRFEMILKSVSTGVILVGIGLLIWRIRF